jgi:hypothetical protein
VLGIVEKRVRPAINLKIAIQASPDMTTELFGQSIHEVFIPSVKNNREMRDCQGKPAILFLDNVRAHCSDQFMKELAKLQLLVSCPPHKSQTFQVLYRVLFGRLKAAKKHLVRDLEESAQLDHVVRPFKAYGLATTSTTIWASFQQTGFDYERHDGIWSLIISDYRKRRSPVFQEIWEIDSPEGSLSQRRRGQVWGWLKNDSLPRNLLQREVSPALDSRPKQSPSTSPFRCPVSFFDYMFRDIWRTSN